MTKTISGDPVTDEAAKFLLHAGVAKSEIVAELGRPTLELKDGRLIGYSWETKTSDFFAWRRGANNNKVIYTRRYWLHLVAFDAAGKITRHERMELDPHGAATWQATEWFENGEPQAPLRTPP